MPKTDEIPTPRKDSSWRNIAIFLGIIAVVGVTVWWTLPNSENAGSTATTVNSATSRDGKAVEGKPAPALNGTTLTGDSFSLAADEQKKPTWVIFNASWCTACRSEAPIVEKIAAAGQVRVVTVFVGEDSDAVRDFTKRVSLTSPTIIADPEETISSAWGYPGLPMHFFIDSDGVIRSQHVGALAHEQVKAIIDKLS